jgi:S1-C subfamily serine protease
MVGSGRRSHGTRLGEGRSRARRHCASSVGLLLAGAISTSLLVACAVPQQVPAARATAPEGVATHSWDAAPPGDRLRLSGGRNLVRSGSGFFVSPAGRLVTSAHVVTGCTAISVRRDGQPAGQAVLLAIDPRNDLALVASNLAAPQIASGSARRQLAIGERVFGLGFSVRENRPVRIGGSFAGRAILPGKDKAFVIRAHVPPGASGGLVVTQTGSLVGMIVGYDTDSPGLAIVVANTEIDRFLAAHGISLYHAPVASRHTAAIERHLLSASVVVQCVPVSSATSLSDKDGAASAAKRILPRLTS